MDASVVNAVSRQVYRKFPEVNGAQPSVKNQPNDSYLLVYRGSATTENGTKLARIVRVVVNAQGKILKMTTSR